MIWTDVAMSVVVLIILISVVIMVRNFFKYHHRWSSKTIDHWYAQFMWKLVGISLCIEWLIQQRSLDYTFIFVTAAALASFIGNIKQHKWEGDRL